MLKDFVVKALAIRPMMVFELADLMVTQKNAVYDVLMDLWAHDIVAPVVMGESTYYKLIKKDYLSDNIKLDINEEEEGEEGKGSLGKPKLKPIALKSIVDLKAFRAQKAVNKALEKEEKQNAVVRDEEAQALGYKDWASMVEDAPTKMKIKTTK